MSDNLKIWDALGKTDPAQTKGFKKSGGFGGTSVKPMWVYKRLTEQFGPAGIGWGVNKPDFQTIHGVEGEVLVYCTVECWHGSRENTIHGVGGDKVVSKNKRGMFHDDEAFKKAFTDAIKNAFKLVGAAADIHMGLFDDDKHVTAMEREFAQPAETLTDDQVGALELYLDASTISVAAILKKAASNHGREFKDLRELPASDFEGVKKAALDNPKVKENA